jgi:isopenicillin N synthase-like dioxygenase
LQKEKAMVTYTAPKRAENVPIIDLKGTFGSDDDCRRAAAARIREACRNTGFFYVVNHGIDQKIIDSAFDQSKRFFTQPETWKLKHARAANSNGYEPLESQTLDRDSPADLKESYTVSKPAEPGTPDHMDNIWPGDLPGFRETIDTYHTNVQRLALHISRLIALSLDMQLGFFDRTFDNQKASLRLLRYPPMPENAKSNQLGAGAHTDFGWITVLAQDSNGGLEIEPVGSEWIAVDPIPGAFIVNLGDLVPEWTNGVYHSSLHRVLNKRVDVDRYSIVLFFNHRYETVVETIPTCLKPGETPRKPFVSGDHRQNRYRESRTSKA